MKNRISGRLGPQSRVRERFQRAQDAVGGGTRRERVRAGLETLAEMLGAPEYLAVLQVYAAATTNEALASALRPVAAEQVKRSLAAGEAFFASMGAADGPELRGLGAVVLYALEALAVDQASIGRFPDAEPMFQVLERMILRTLEESD